MDPVGKTLILNILGGYPTQFVGNPSSRMVQCFDKPDLKFCRFKL